jgi:hypothetical protein
MTWSARHQAVLDAMAIDVIETAPLLAGYLEQGPARLRERGIKPRSLRGLVPDYPRLGLRRRVARWWADGKF